MQCNILLNLLFTILFSLGLATGVLYHYGACQTENYGAGKCLAKDNCTFYAADSETIKNSEQCESKLRRDLVCCPNNENALPKFAARVDTTPSPATSTNSTSSELPGVPNCGVVLRLRIYNGENTTLTEFPWTTLIEYTDYSGKKRHSCGGSFIGKRWVLTAAHCIRDQDPNVRVTGVRLGEWNTATDPDCANDECNNPHIDVPVDRILVHENYNENHKYSNDIALLRLKRRIHWQDYNHLLPICLPMGDDVRDLLVDVVGDVAGWGRTEQNDMPSIIKRKANMTVRDLNKCRVTFREYGYELLDSQICVVGAPNVDTCRGDSGSALMMEGRHSNGRKYIYAAGVLSYGSWNCGKGQFPSIYTRVGSFVDWIKNTIETNS